MLLHTKHRPGVEKSRSDNVETVHERYVLLCQMANAKQALAALLCRVFLTFCRQSGSQGGLGCAWILIHIVSELPALQATAAIYPILT